jgi:hypothetical protein
MASAHHAPPDSRDAPETFGPMSASAWHHTARDVRERHVTDQCHARSAGRAEAAHIANAATRLPRVDWPPGFGPCGVAQKPA